MRTTLLILCAFIPTIIFAQDSATISRSDVPAVYDEGLKPFLDSLKIRLLADTTKFKRTDLIFTTIGRRNIKPYSPLFIVNGAYIYKLDIISGSEVLTFVNEI